MGLRGAVYTRGYPLPPSEGEVGEVCVGSSPTYRASLLPLSLWSVFSLSLASSPNFRALAPGRSVSQILWGSSGSVDVPVGLYWKAQPLLLPRLSLQSIQAIASDGPRVALFPLWG